MIREIVKHMVIAVWIMSSVTLLVTLVGAIVLGFQKDRFDPEEDGVIPSSGGRHSKPEITSNEDAT